jgi:DNA end-binding protein Ku
MRSINNTSINFGLVNVAVKVYAATENHDVKFHQRHGGQAGCRGLLGRQNVCKDCGQVVEFGDIVKGFDVDGATVILTGDELAAVENEAGKALEVVQFVHAEEVDPMLLQAPYYLEPSAASLSGYALLREVLTETDRVGMVRYTHRGRTHLAVLRCAGAVLVLHNIAWPDELRAPEFAILTRKVTLEPKAVKMATQLVESMMATFDGAELVDVYQRRLAAVVEAKAVDTPLPVVSAASADGGVEDVSDLLAALEASIKRHPAGEGRGKPPAKRAPAKRAAVASKAAARKAVA